MADQIGSLFSAEAEVTDLFDFGRLESAPVMQEPQAQELATAADIINETNNADNTTLELTTVGSSISVDAAVEKVKSEKQASAVQGAYNAAGEGDVEGLASKLEEANKRKPLSNDEIIASAAERYVQATGNKIDPEVLENLSGSLAYSSNWVKSQRYQNQLIKSVEAKHVQDASFLEVAGDWVEILAPYLSPEEERRMRANLVDEDSSGIRAFLQRSEVANNLASRLLEMPTSMASEELEKIVDAVVKSETIFGENTLFSGDILLDLRNKLAEGRTVAGEFSGANILSELIGSFDFLEINEFNKLVKSFLKIGAGAPVKPKLLQPNKVSVAVGTALESSKKSLSTSLTEELPTKFKTRQQAREVAKKSGTRVEDLGTGSELRWGLRTNGGSLLDTITRLNPEAGIGVLKQGDGVELANRMGNSPEDLASRMVPVPQDAPTTLGINASFLDLEHKTISVLLTDEELGTLPEKLANRFARSSGNSLTPHHQLTTTIQNDLDDSAGLFRTRFGSDDNTGFKYPDAESAMKSSVIGEDARLVQVDKDTGVVRPAVDGDTNVFVEVDLVHRFNPSTDAGGLRIGDRQVGGSFRRQVLPPSRYLDKELWSRATSMWDFNTADQSRLVKMAETISKLTPHRAEDLNEILRAGDANGQVFTRETAGLSIGKPVDSKTWSAYQAYQDLQGEFYTLTNKRYRENLDSGGFKLFTGFGDGQQFVRPIKKKPTVSAVRTDASQKRLEELRSNPDAVWGEVYDPVTKTSQKASQALIDELYANGGVVGRVRGSYTDEAGNVFDHIIVRNTESFQPLPATVLDRLTGYVPRFYKDGGYLVKSVESRVVNGSTMEYLRPVGIAASRGDAVRLAERMGVEVEFGKTVTLAREAKSELDLFTGSGEFGFTPISSRKRGEQLQGVNENPAGVVSPLAALQRQIQGVSRKLNTDTIGLFEKRWMNTFGRWLPDNKGLFPEKFDINDLRVPKHIEDAGEADKWRESAKSWHHYTQLLRRSDEDPSAQWMNRKLWNIGNNLTESENAVARRLGEKVIKMTETHFKRNAKEITTTMIITSRLLYQGIANPTFSGAAILAHSPAKGIPSLVKALPLSMALLARKSGNWDVLKRYVSRGLGVDEVEAEKWVKGFEESGMLDANLSDDFLRHASDEYGNISKSTVQSIAKFYGGKLNPMRYARSGLTKSIIIGNMFAYNHALKLWKQANPRLNAYSKRAQAQIIADARKFSQTQNSVDQFAWQRSDHPASFALQFMQFVLKAWYDMILDPAAKLTTGKSVGNAGKWANNRTQAATTLAMVNMLFGQTGILGENGGAATSDWLRSTTEEMIGKELPEEVWQVVRGGFVDLSMNKLFAGITGDENTNISFSARIGPGAMADSLIWMWRDGGQVDMLGAMGSQIAYMGKAAKATKDAIFDPNYDMSQPANQTALFESYTSMFSGARDVWAAYAAFNAGHAIDSRGNRQSEVNTAEVLGRLASFKTTDELDSMRTQASMKKRKEKLDAMVNLWSKEYFRMFKVGVVEGMEDAELLNKRRDFLQQAATTIEPHLADAFLSSLLNKVEPNYNAMDRRLQTALKYNTVEETIEELELLKSKYGEDGDVVKAIDDIIWSFGSVVDEE